jgi:hypothetical protein
MRRPRAKALGLKTTFSSSAASTSSKLSRGSTVLRLFYFLLSARWERLGGVMARWQPSELCENARLSQCNDRSDMAHRERWRTPSDFRSCLSCSEALELIRPRRRLVTLFVVHRDLRLGQCAFQTDSYVYSAGVVGKTYSQRGLWMLKESSGSTRGYSAPSRVALVKEVSVPRLT